MAKIFVVEDERMIAEDIMASLIELGHESTGVASDFQGALDQLKINQPDLVLLDIKLDGEKDGIELAKEVVGKFKLPIIYLSSNSDSNTLKRAFETAPQAFLTKPFNKNDLSVAVELALHNSGRPIYDIRVIDNALFVKKADRYVKVYFKDVLYVKSDGSYSTLVTLREQHTLSINSQRFLDIANSSAFHRVHRSYIVNLNNVDSFSATSVFVGPDQIPISKSLYAELMTVLRKI